MVVSPDIVFFFSAICDMKRETREYLIHVKLLKLRSIQRQEEREEVSV